MKIVNILGTEYTILLDVSDEDMPAGADGCVDPSIKQIKLLELEPSSDSVKDLEAYQKKVLRHEIIHAFLYESGLWNCSNTVDAWACNEEMSDFFAIQFPKILKAFEEADCI